MGTVECEDGRVRRTVLGEIVCKTTSRCEDGCARGRSRTKTVACEVGRARGWFAHKHEDGSRGPSDFADCRDSPVVPASRPYRSALSACAVSPKIPLLLPTLRESWVSVEGCVDSGWLVSVGRRCDARFANYKEHQRRNVPIHPEERSQQHHDFFLYAQFFYLFLLCSRHHYEDSSDAIYQFFPLVL